MEYFRQQDAFLKEMISFYHEGNLDKTFQPYFEWKEGGFPPSRAEAYQMMGCISDSLDELFDSKPVTRKQLILEAIDEELTNILLLLK